MKKIYIFVVVLALVLSACGTLPLPPGSTDPTVAPTAELSTPKPTSTAVVTETIPTKEVVDPGTGDVELVFKASDALDYPSLITPDYNRQLVFPDVEFGGRPKLAEYLPSWESNDYFHNDIGDVDVPMWSHRMITSGRIKIDELDIDCTGDEVTGCGAIIINHFGPTAYWEDATVDTGFTVVGLVFDMETPEKVTLAAQALLDHMTGRMTVEPDGSNCSTRDACEKFEWHVIVVGNGEVQIHWTGVYTR